MSKSQPIPTRIPAVIATFLLLAAPMAALVVAVPGVGAIHDSGQPHLSVAVDGGTQFVSSIKGGSTSFDVEVTNEFSLIGLDRIKFTSDDSLKLLFEGGDHDGDWSPDLLPGGVGIEFTAPDGSQLGDGESITFTLFINLQSPVADGDIININIIGYNYGTLSDAGEDAELVHGHTAVLPVVIDETPYITSAETNDAAPGDGYIDTYTVTYSKPIDSISTFAASDWTVAGYTVDDAQISGSEVELEISQITGGGALVPDTGVVPNLTYVGTGNSIKGPQGTPALKNDVATSTNGKADDDAPPALVEAIIFTGTNQLEATFSEEVFTSSDGTGDLVPGDFTFSTFSGDDSFTAVAHTGDEVVLTANRNFTDADFIASAELSTVDVYDLAGNPASTSLPVSENKLIIDSAKTQDLDDDAGSGRPDGRIDAVVLTFNREVDLSNSNYEQDDFEVDGYEVINSAWDSNQKQLTLYLTQKASADTGVTPGLNYTAANGAETAPINPAGDSEVDLHDFTGGSIDDGAPPVPDRIETMDDLEADGATAGQDGTLDAVRVVFSEDVDVTDTGNGWSIDGTGVTVVPVTGAADELRIDIRSLSLHTGATPTVAFDTGPADSAPPSNALGPFSRIATDAAGPVLISAHGNPGEPSLNLTFSEPVQGSGSGVPQRLTGNDIIYNPSSSNPNSGNPFATFAEDASNASWIHIFLKENSNGEQLVFAAGDLDGTDKVAFGSGVKDLIGNAASQNEVPIEDDDPPEVVEVLSLDGDKDGHLDALRVTFSEPVVVTGGSGSAFAWSVDQRTVAAVLDGGGGAHPDDGTSVNVTYQATDVDPNIDPDTVLFVAITESADYDTGVQPTLQYTGSGKGTVADQLTNALVAGSSWADYVDGAAPLLLSATTVDDGVITGLGSIDDDDTHRDGHLDGYVLEFTEDMAPPTGTGGWDVTGRNDVSIMNLGSDKLFLSFTSATPDTNETPGFAFDGLNNNVTDSEGVPLLALDSSGIDLVDNARPVLVHVVGHPGDDTVVAVFSEPVYNQDGGPLDTASFEYVDGADQPVAERIDSVQHTAGELEATIVLNGTLTQANLTASHGIRPVPDFANDTVGLDAAVNTADFLDVSPPEVVGLTTFDDGHNGHIDRIVIAFNENLNTTHSNFEPTDFMVEGYVVNQTHSHVQDMAVILVLDEGLDPDTGAKPRVSYDRTDGTNQDPLTDTVGLEWDGKFPLGARSEDAADGALPVLLSANFTVDSPFLDARFSEPVFGEDDGTGAVLLDAFEFTNGTVTGAVNQTLDDIEHNAGSPVVRFNASADFVASDAGDSFAVMAGVYDLQGLAAVNRTGAATPVPVGIHDSPKVEQIRTVGKGDGELASIEVTFDRNVNGDAGLPDASAWSVDGHEITGIGKAPDGRTIRLFLKFHNPDTAQTPAVNYTRPSVGAVVDADGVPLASFKGLDGTDSSCSTTSDLCTTDGAGPVLLKAFGSPGREVVKLIFSEPLDATDIDGDYVYHNGPGAVLQDIDVVNLDSASTYVAQLMFKDATSTGSFALTPDDIGADSISVAVGKLDSSGNQGPTANVTIRDDVPPRIDSAVTVDGDRDGWIDALKVTLSEPYANLSASPPSGAFVISDGYGDGMHALAGGTGVPANNGVTYPATDDRSFYLAFTELPDLDATATGGDTSVTPTLNHTGGSGITDRYNDLAATGSPITAVDGVGPVALSAASVDDEDLSDGIDLDNGDGYLDAYLVEFSEEITTTSVFGWRLGGVVNATDAYLVGADGMKTTSTFRLMVTFDGRDLEENHTVLAGTGDTPQLTYKNGGITDVPTNPLLEVTDGSLVETDGAAPAIRYVTAQPNGKEVTVVFSEGVDNGNDARLTASRFQCNECEIVSVSHVAFSAQAVLTLNASVAPADLDSPSSGVQVGVKANQVLDRSNLPANTILHRLVDRTGPAVLSATTDDTDNDGRIDDILILFDEDVDFSGFEQDDFEVLGYTIAGSETVSTKELRLTLEEDETRDYDTGETPTIVWNGNDTTALTDTTGKMTKWNGLFPATTDGAVPVLISAQTVDNTTVRVLFSEPVLAKNGTDDVPLDVDQFVYLGGGDDDGNTVSILTHRLGDRFADLTLETPLEPKDRTDDPDTQDRVGTIDVLDSEGYAAVAYDPSGTSVPVVGGPMLDSITTRGVDRVQYLEVVFSRAVNDTSVLASITEGKWHSTLGSITGNHTLSGDVTNDDTIYLAFSPGTNHTDDTGAKPKVSYNGTSLKDTDDGPLLPFAAHEAIDAVAPRILTIETVDDTGDGELDSLRVVFSEPMNLTGFDGADWKVEGQTGALAITESSPSRTIHLPLAADIGTGAKPHVTYTVDAGFNDTAGNALPGGESASVDKAAPVLLSAESAGTGTRDVTLVFSEPVQAASLTKDNLTYMGAANGGATGIESIKPYDGGDEVVIVLNADFATADHNADTIAATADLLDAADNAASTTPVAVVTDVVDPAAVGDVTLTDVKANSVTLEFDSVGDDGSQGEASFYVVGYHEGSSNVWATATKVNFTADPGADQSHTVLGLKNETTYSFAVLAKDDAGNLGGVSDWESVKTLADGTPPTGTLEVTSTTHTSDQASSKTTATLSWNELTDPDSTVSYYYKVGSEAAYTVKDTDTKATGRSLTKTGLADGTHYVHVAAISAGGPTPAQPFKLVIDTVAPGAVGDFAAGTATPLGITLSWEAPGDDGATGTAKEYQLYRSNATFTTADLDNLTLVSGVVTPAAAGTAQSFEVTGLSPDTEYHFAIRARDDAGNAGPLSAVVKKSTLPDTTPPTGDLDLRSTSHVAGAKSNLRDLSFRWDAASDAETDVFYRYALVQDADDGLSSSHKTTTETGVDLDGVEPGNWTFLVAAESAGGRGATESFQVILLGISDEDLEEANEDVVVKVTRKGDTNVVTWKLPGDTPGDVEGVQVLRSNSPYRVVATIPADSEEFEDGTFVDDSEDAKATSKYLVTMYYGESVSLGKQPEGQDLVLSEPLMAGAVAPATPGSVFGHVAFYLGLVAVLAIVGFAIAAVVLHNRQQPALVRRQAERDSWEASA